MDGQEISGIYCYGVRTPRELRPQESTRLTIRRYPWFLETFDGYEFPIQRADAIRYFVLAHFGGIYIDLDDVRLPTPPSSTSSNNPLGLQPEPRPPPRLLRLGAPHDPDRYLQ